MEKISSLPHMFLFSLMLTITSIKNMSTAAPFHNSPCLERERSLLLELKNELIFNSSQSLSIVRWNHTKTDCCNWDGVQCGDAGHVISLLLGGEAISGGIEDSSSLFRLRYLQVLDLSYNQFNIQIPRGIHRLPRLRQLILTGAGFIGPIPSTLGNLTKLTHLDLSSNFLTGPIPSFHLSEKLTTIDLSRNNLGGSLSNSHFEGLSDLAYLHLDHNSLSGSIPQSLFTGLPSLQELWLSNNQFSGQLNEFPIVNISNLEILDLSSNRLEGPIPNSSFHLQTIHTLSLSNNLFHGTFQLRNIQSLPSLVELGLSYNNLSVEAANMSSSSFESPQLHTLHLASCDLYDFLDLRKQYMLADLDLSNNHIAGHIPSWIWEIGSGKIALLDLSRNMLEDLQKPYYIPDSLGFLDLHSNQLHGELPQLPQEAIFVDYSSNKFDKPIPPSIIDVSCSADFLSFANNSLSGTIPTFICNATRPLVLDLSFNNFSGGIPSCLLNKHLEVLNLRGNNFNEALPNQFSCPCNLKTLDVSNNNLSGKIPKSISNCKNLTVFNVGNNNIDDVFPCMLSSSLHVLVLKSNRFHGELKCGKSWPNLQIVDISSNNFSGKLQPLNFSSWRGMMLQSDPHLRPNHSRSTFLRANNFYDDYVTITVKGTEMKLVNIWPDFTSIDLSCNNFQGDIPGVIGNLSSLYLLNLSHNALTGTIPKSLGALTELESLDVSVNHLRGRIPEELARLTFLSILNVSHNELVGMIPNGRQFQTFSADSFEGNTGLCGFPLNRNCSSTNGDGNGSTPEKVEDEEVEWEYVCAALGYVVGLGSVVWILLFCGSIRERYFEKIEEVVENIFEPRRRRRRRRGRRVVRKH